jgi:hypothetical protein
MVAGSSYVTGNLHLGGVIPKRPRFYQRAEGSPVAHSVVAGDPSFRLKNGCAQDDAIGGHSSAGLI